MFGPRFHLFTIFGFRVGVDLSWFIIAVLVAWSLAEGWFANPDVYPMLVDQPGVRWSMGIIGALALFGSIVLHELGHAKVAETQGVPMKGITLFIFGGVAEMTQEPPSAKAEFLVAIAGPIVSVIVGLICLGAWYAGQTAEWPVSVTAVLAYLGIINLVLVAFNMIPAFPLDGGRVLRSILWAAKKNLKWATRVTSRIGAGFGILLMILAVVQLLAGNFIGAMWWFLIGMFLRAAAQMSYQQLLIRRALEGEPVSRFMNPTPIAVQPDQTLDRVVHDYLYRYHHKLWPVVDNGDLRGCLTLDRIKEVPQDRWDDTHVRDLLQTCDDANTIEHDRDAMEALTVMRNNDRSRLMVTDHGQLVGMVTLKDLMSFFSLKVELEEKPRRRAA